MKIISNNILAEPAFPELENEKVEPDDDGIQCGVSVIPLSFREKAQPHVESHYDILVTDINRPDKSGRYVTGRVGMTPEYIDLICGGDSE